MAIGAVFMRPLFAETLDLARFSGSDVFPVPGNLNILMADIAFPNLLGLVDFMIEGHAIFETDDVDSFRGGRNQH